MVVVAAEGAGDATAQTGTGRTILFSSGSEERADFPSPKHHSDRRKDLVLLAAFLTLLRRPMVADGGVRLL